MATAETMPRPHDRHHRRRPFSHFMRRLANLKSSSKHNTQLNDHTRRPNGAVQQPASYSIHPPLVRPDEPDSAPDSRQSTNLQNDAGPSRSNKSAAPTISTHPETTNSEAAASKAGTIMTAGGAMSSHVNGGEGSTFSSPAPSINSMTTTLTTIQSGTPGPVLQGPNTGSQPHGVQFTHQFPSTATASAIPSHVTGHHGAGHPTTYHMATANNLLTDNASVLTLASSSKRRRRNSLDTNASVKALAPSSVFGGSRESLPLSVLSTNPQEQSSHPRPTLAATERASVYSSSGVAPALSSERNSYYAARQINDTASVRSGLASHGRNDSITGSIGGIASGSSPMHSPRETPALHEMLSRRNSGRGEIEDAEEDEHEKPMPGGMRAEKS